MIRTPRSGPIQDPPAGRVADPCAGRVVERPDGFYGLALDGRQEFGPFKTFDEARASIEAVFNGLDGETPVEAETLAEVESEVGIADWLDPETGEPAEGGCPPHLDAE
ncbi:MAG: hypothetical protein Q7T97_03380 [Burkholderiaceae bacterium]|nr:hypothetical protein [Burkholderiaceae bacterium]